MKEMRAVEQELKTAENRFSMLTDPDLIESEIYAIKCLQAKWRHLHKIAREEDRKETAQVNGTEEKKVPPFAVLKNETG